MFIRLYITTFGTNIFELFRKLMENTIIVPSVRPFVCMIVPVCVAFVCMIVPVCVVTKRSQNRLMDYDISYW
jgi:hypothetical protein